MTSVTDQADKYTTYQVASCDINTNGKRRAREELKGGKKWVERGATAATGPGRGATDHTADSVSLVKPTSCENNSPRTRVDTPNPPPPPPTSPSLPVEQLTSTSRRPTDQQCQDAHVPRNGTRHTCEDNKWSQGEVESSSQGSQEADNKDSEDNNDHHAHVEPQQPKLTHQTAVNKAADTMDPHAVEAGRDIARGTL
ncbi:hypothetical protein BDN67DRAFT_984749 [Paxillus ammoniavirescens]|nr:hypothetical protein BDN67DRAFT_984749 [Paxillus ammoniavirescens]